jgi:uncharacterized membrane protein
MFWLIAPLVIAVLLFLRGFRKSALGVVVVALIAAAVVYYLNERAQERAETRISASEISLENVAVRQTFDASYELTGRLKNGSSTYQVTGISLNVKLRDCRKGNATQCEAAGEAAGQAGITVPPGESRDFTVTLYFGKGHRPPKGTLAWDYEIESVTAKRQ